MLSSLKKYPQSLSTTQDSVSYVYPNVFTWPPKLAQCAGSKLTKLNLSNADIHYFQPGQQIGLDSDSLSSDENKENLQKSY